MMMLHTPKIDHDIIKSSKQPPDEEPDTSKKKQASAKPFTVLAEVKEEVKDNTLLQEDSEERTNDDQGTSNKMKKKKKKEKTKEKNPEGLRKIFEQYKKSYGQDIRISAKDLQECFRDMDTFVSLTDCQKFLNDIDIDGSGAIDIKELLNFVLFVIHPNTDTKEELEKSFLVFDPDDTGFLSPYAFRHILSNLGDDMTEEEIDYYESRYLDFDGNLNYAQVSDTAFESMEAYKKENCNGVYAEIKKKKSKWWKFNVTKINNINK